MIRRVLFVDHVSRILGGAEVNLVELIGQPDAHPPWTVAVACDPSGRLHETLGSAGVERHDHAFDPALGRLRVVGRRFPLAGALGGFRALRAARVSLDRIVARVRPDILVSCTNKDHFAAWPAARRACIPSVWWVNDILSGDFFPWFARRAFLSQARRGATRLVAVSDFARDILIDQGLTADRMVTIHNGIPVERYLARPRGSLRQGLSMGDDEPLVGVLGRFTPWKGQDLFIRLAAAWCRSRPKGQFALIGHAFNEDQPFELALREQVRSLGLRNRIHFIPFQRDAAAALADLDVLIHPSLKPEPFGRVLIEAMAAGIPVIAARDGGVPEIITDGADGFLATPGSVPDYLARLEPLLADPDLRSRVGKAGQRTVMARFTLPRVREQFESLFANLP